MRFPYSTASSTQGELDSFPRLPLTLHYGQQQIMEAGLVDSGATVNVLPYGLGTRLGAVWDDDKATIRLAGNLENFAVSEFPPVRLAFVWTQIDNVLLILGQMKSFMEFDVCFFRSEFEFEVNPQSFMKGHLTTACSPTAAMLWF
jgi:hypothetical protein